MSTGSTWTSSAGTHASDSSASAIDVLAVGPHPDDVELFIGGTTRHLAQLGHRVVILDLTRGESATRGTPAIRAVEAARAAASWSGWRSSVHGHMTSSGRCVRR